MKRILSNTRILAATTGLLASAAIMPAQASVVYQSTAYSGMDTGDYILSSNNFMGAAFQLTTATKITGIGAQFGANNGGAIFGTIVPLASLTAFPAGSSADLSSISLASTVFSVPSGTTALDFVTPLSVTLNAGSYGVIFGAGQFGSTASGFAGLGGYNTPTGTSPELFRSFFSTDWTRFDDNIRIVVEGNSISTVPLPAGLPLMAAGLGVLGLLGARHYRRGDATIG
ncbi:VPLPA-CTERM sorting domain-containing protein [Lichenifustis flavocetrariae]|uniref:VPLPA-CTERM sorting domain-containing protein n=1 Tax=Lichenifustis flavocetrariae TaxID=2949735 RepID=A0AA41YU65_9HYPH|nr:VPLPA-CTERM sorting domain-containing protein [Lichenifustis flavocetrariae]MCW6508639.1 VPLPA-CTERM sorting domain-containing protein [Lichenifustis flavocetrariae]